MKWIPNKNAQIFVKGNKKDIYCPIFCMIFFQLAIKWKDYPQIRHKEKVLV